jgi:integrase
LNFDRYFIGLPPAINKNNIQHQIVISKQLMPYIAHFKTYPKDFYLFSTAGAPSSKMVGTRYFGLRHQILIAKLGFDTTRYSLYSWKHTGAILLYNHTNDINFVKNQIGHQNIATTEIYLQRRKYWNDDKSRDRFPEI